MHIFIYIFLPILIHYCYNNSIKHKSDLPDLYKNKNHTLFRDITLCATGTWNTEGDVKDDHIFHQKEVTTKSTFLTKIFNIGKHSIYELLQTGTSEGKATNPTDIKTYYITNDDEKNERTLDTILHYTSNINTEGTVSSKTVPCEPINKWGTCDSNVQYKIAKKEDGLFVDDCETKGPYDPEVSEYSTIINAGIDYYPNIGTPVTEINKINGLDGIRVSSIVEGSSNGKYGTTIFNVVNDVINMCHLNNMNGLYILYILKGITIGGTGSPFTISAGTSEVYQEKKHGDNISVICDDTPPGTCPDTKLFTLQVTAANSEQNHYIYYNQYPLGTDQDSTIKLSVPKAIVSDTKFTGYSWCFKDMNHRDNEYPLCRGYQIPFVVITAGYEQINEVVVSSISTYSFIDSINQLYEYIPSTSLTTYYYDKTNGISKDDTYSKTRQYLSYKYDVYTTGTPNTKVRQYLPLFGWNKLSEAKYNISYQKIETNKNIYTTQCRYIPYTFSGKFDEIFDEIKKYKYYQEETTVIDNLPSNIRLSTKIGSGISALYGTTYFHKVDGGNDINMCHINNMGGNNKYQLFILTNVGLGTRLDDKPYVITYIDMKIYERDSTTLSLDKTICEDDTIKPCNDYKTFEIELVTTGNIYNVYYDEYKLTTNTNNDILTINKIIYDDMVSKGYGWCFNNMFIVGDLADNITYCAGKTKPWEGPPAELTQFSESADPKLNKFIKSDVIYYYEESGSDKTVYEYTKIDSKQDIVNTMEYKHQLLYTYNNIDDDTKKLKIKNYESHFGWGVLKEETNIIAYLEIPPSTDGGLITAIYTDKCVDTSYENNNKDWEAKANGRKYYRYIDNSEKIESLSDDILISKIDGTKYAFTTYHEDNKLCHVNKLNNKFRLFIFDLKTLIFTGSSPYTIQYTEIRQYDWDNKVKCTYDDGGSSTDNGCTKINLFKIEKNGDNLYYFYYDEYDLGNSSPIEDKNKPEINQEDVDKFKGFEWCFNGFTIKPPITSDEFPYCGKPKITWDVPISGGHLFYETLTRAINTYKYLYPLVDSGTIYEYILNNYNEDITIIEYKYNAIPSINSNSNIAIFNTIKLNTYIKSGEIYTKTIHSYNIFDGGDIGENKDFYISKTTILDDANKQVFSDICRQTDYTKTDGIDSIIGTLGTAKYWTLTEPGSSSFDNHKNKRLSVDFGNNKYYTTFIQEESSGDPKKINMCSVTNINNRYQILIFKDIILTTDSDKPKKISLDSGGTYILYEEEDLTMKPICDTTTPDTGKIVCPYLTLIYTYESNTTYAYLYYNELQVGMTDKMVNKYKIPKTLSEKINTLSPWCFTGMDNTGDIEIPGFISCSKSITEWISPVSGGNIKFRNDITNKKYFFIHTNNKIISEYNDNDKSIIEYIYDGYNHMINSRVATYNTYKHATYTKIGEPAVLTYKKEVSYEKIFGWTINKLENQPFNISRMKYSVASSEVVIYGDQCNTTEYSDTALPTPISYVYTKLESVEPIPSDLNKLRITLFYGKYYATTIFYGKSKDYQVCHINNLNGIYTVIISKTTTFPSGTATTPELPEKITFSSVKVFEENNSTNILKEICSGNMEGVKCSIVQNGFTIEYKKPPAPADGAAADRGTFNFYLNEFYLGTNKIEENNKDKLTIKQRYIDQLEDNLWCFIDMNIKQDNNNEGDNEDDEDDDNNGRFDNINNYNYFIIIIITYLFIFII